MKRSMRRSRQELNEADLKDVIERNNAGVLSLIGDDGYPYGVPITYVYGEDENFYFHSAISGHKIDAVRNCHKACFTIIDENKVVPDEYTTYFRSIVAIGDVHLIEDDQEKLKTIKLLSQKVRPGHIKEMDAVIKKEWKGFVMIKFITLDLKGKEAMELMKAKK